MAFGSLVGQREIKRRLSLVVKGGNDASFLFTGPEGIGKHTFAEEFAKALICEKPTEDGACGACPCCTYYEANTLPDIIRLKGEGNNVKVAEVRRQVVSETATSPQLAKRKVFIINCDALNEEGQNAILKSVEEPPKNSAFILLSSDKSKLLPTIISRVIEFKMSNYSNSEIFGIIKNKATDMSDSEIENIVEFASGIPGKAIALISDEAFAEYKETVFNIVVGMPKASYTDILFKTYSYFEENKDRVNDLLLFMLWVLGDICILLKSPKASEIKYKDKRDELQKFIRENSHLTTMRVSNASNHIVELIKGFDVNVNYEGACCSMLLKVHKELAQ